MDLFQPLDDYADLQYEQLKKKAEDCMQCLLHKTRTQVVFGQGPVPCDLMLIGEAPGEQEDLSGLAFVGKAGQLLTKVLESADIDREKDIYITNIIKCRPPQNRTPQANEVEACHLFLIRQIQLVNPKIILLAGAPAVKAVLKVNDSMSNVRGKWFSLKNTEIKIMPIYHPSFLLRNPARGAGSPKWQTWQDMQEIKNAVSFIKKVKELGKNEN